MLKAQLKILYLINSVAEISWHCFLTVNLQVRESVYQMFYDKSLSVIIASVKRRRCESKGRHWWQFCIDQSWNILISDYKVTGSSYSLKYELILLPEFLRENNWKVKPLLEDVSLLRNFSVESVRPRRWQVMIWLALANEFMRDDIPW